MNTRDVLVAARALLADPDHWTRGHYARARDTSPVSPNSPKAVCWCAIGAVRRATSPFATREEHFSAIIDALYDVLGAGVDLAEWNDAPSTTHADVLAVFDAAIEKAGES